MNERINAALKRAARISDCTHQGHVLEEPESNFEAGIQGILDLLELAEAETVRLQRGEGNLLQLVVFLHNARRKLVALADRE